MIELTREEKDILIEYKHLLQKNKLDELFEELFYYHDTYAERITQFLVDKLGNKIFKYFEHGSIPSYTFSGIDFSNICANGTLELPKNITQVEENAFEGSEGYHTLILHTSDIDRYAFSSINTLTTLIITDVDASTIIRRLSYDAFYECLNINDIYLPCSREEWVEEWNKTTFGPQIALNVSEDEFARAFIATDKAYCTIHWK